MIDFLNNWIEQIAITVIIVSIFELILPNGKLKKYIKVILGIYVIFCIISPFVNKINLYDIGKIEIENYIENVEQNKTINQQSINKRLQDLYIEQLKNDLAKKIEEAGYKIQKCEIEANLSTASTNPGIHKIKLSIEENQKNIADIKKIEIGKNQINQNNSEIDNQNELISQNNLNEQTEKIKEELARYYEINKEIIEIEIKN